MTINGSGYNTVLQNNAVFFNGVRATINSATSTQLNVNVPLGASLGEITVVDLQNSKQGTSNLYFTPTFNPNKGSTWTVNDFDPVVSSTGNVGLFVEFADFNGDGKLDMVQSKTTSTAGFSIFRNVSTPGILTTNSFTSPLIVDVGQTFLEAITVADYNNDGKLDIITAGSPGGTGTTIQGTISIYINNTTTASISFAAPVTRTYNMRLGSCAGRVGDIKCEDLNGDGLADVVVSNSNYSFGSSSGGNQNCSSTVIGALFTNTSSGGLVSLGTQNLLTVSNFRTRNSFMTQLTIADLNQDGKKDLLFGVRGRTYLFKNISSPGALASSSFVITNLSILDGDRGIAVADFDGDGKLDIAVSGRMGNNLTSNNLRLYKNTTNNNVFSFATAVVLSIGGNHQTVNNQSLAAGDITGDGKPEILCGANSPRILLNKITTATSTWSTSSFSILSSIGLSGNANACKIVDLDGDGRSDIAAITGNTGNIVSMRRSHPIPDISVGALALNYCPGVQISVPYTASYSLSAGNIFTVQLSNATGSFTTPTTIGTLTSSAISGFITCTIPANATAGTGYKIRVNASTPAVTGIANNGNIVINTNIVPTISIQASQTQVCLNSAVGFTSNFNNTGANPTFQWYKNGTLQGATGNSFTDISPSSNDSYFVVMNANSGCAVNNVNSNTVFLNGANQVTPSVIIQNSQTTICESTTSVSYTANPVNGGNAPAYQWQKNGVSVGTNSSIFIDTNPIEGDQVSVVMTSNASCLTNATVLSNTLTLSYSAVTVVPTVAISTSQTNICSGVNQVVFNADFFNGGYSPTFQWKLNGVNVGTNSEQFVLNNPLGNEQISLVMVSNADCATPPSVTSNTIVLTTQGVSLPTISVSTPVTNLCGASSIIYSAALTNGGTNPLVSWYKNGVLVLQGVNNLVSNSPVSGDEVYATLFSNASCLTSSNATSNTVTVNVQPVIVPTVQLVLSQGTNPKCPGASQTLHAVVSNGGSDPTYSWFLGGSPFANETTEFLTSSNWTIDNAIYCQVIPNNFCQSTNLLLTPEFIVDEGVLGTYYIDGDGDGFGDPTQTINDCGAPQGYVDNTLDCDDADGNSYPGNIEVCGNGVDEDCLNGDDDCPIPGCTDPNACNYDLTAGIDDGSCLYPTAEICNGLDDNCDGEIDEFVTNTYYTDNDGDGFGNVDNFILSCDLPGGYTDNSEDCDDGNVTYNDLDGDGFGVGAPEACGTSFENNDCDDFNVMVFPGQFEECNQSDDNCDGEIDEGLTFTDYYFDSDLDGFGGDLFGGSCIDPGLGYTIQAGDCDDLEPTAYPSGFEICENFIDEDCDGSDLACEISGCTDPLALNYDPAATLDDGSCTIEGCTDPTAFNYNPSANTDDGSCVIFGCTELTALNFNPSATADDGSCIVTGCTNFIAMNYNPLATIDDGSCLITGCTDPLASNFNPEANLTDGSCEYFGCTDPLASNFLFFANIDDGSCIYTGCTNPAAVNFDPQATEDDGSCIIEGCSDATASNYDPTANTDNGSCIYAGCTNPAAVNFDPQATEDDGSCIIEGCTDVAACNFDPEANFDDGSCVLPQPEVCNNLDDDCNDLIDDGLELFSFYADVDLDGIGSGPILGETCNFILDAGFSIFGDDCDDNDPTISPIANEICNSVDDNCDGQFNEGLWIEAYLDDDGDGFGNDGIAVDGVCELTSGLVGVGGDCDDQSALINPDASEICNELDDNCNNLTDEGLGQELYADADGDGFGDFNNAIFTCLESFGFVSNADDCNDNQVTFDDSDEDGFGAIEPSACGTLLIGNDCDDNNPNAQPGGTEVCGNGIDEDCSGEDLICTVQGCTDIAACNFEPLASEDDGSCTYAQIEICNGVDDNCNGQIDEGIAGQLVNALNVNTALFPTCTAGNIASANLNSGSDTPWIAGNGNDIWYKLTAQYNAIRVGLSAATGDNEIRLYRDFNGCVTLVAEEHEVTAGNQTLISDQLEVGGVYYILIHQISGPANASAKVCFNHFTASTCDHVYSNGTGVYNNVCRSFKLSYRPNATQYLVDVLSCTMSGIDLAITPWTYNTVAANSIVSRLGDILPSNTDVASKVYTVRVPVMYNLPDAANNLNSIVAYDNQTCTITLNSENAVALRLSDRCPATKPLNAAIAPDRTVCGAIRYDWEFTQVLPTAGQTQVIQGGSNASVFFLSNVPGVGVGKTYSVRVRPVHNSGVTGNWGTAYCLRVGSSGMATQSENQSENVLSNESRVSSISIYPNPTATGSFVLEYNGTRRGELIFAQESMTELVMMDITGKIVFKTNIVVNGNATEINFGDLESGLYLIDFGGERSRLQVVR